MTGGNRKLYMVSCHNCFVYETWGNKEMGRREDLRSSFRERGKSESPCFNWGVEPLRHHVFID